MGKNIFVTGGSGFIGSNLVERLLQHGHNVYAIMRRQDQVIDRRIKHIKGDILAPETFSNVIKGFDFVFHTAAYISFNKKDFEKAYEINVIGTRNLLEASYRAGVEKVVHLSACSVLGFSKNKDTIFFETSNPEIGKGNVYAYTKKLAEEEVQKYAQKGMDISIANISTVYGQGDRKLNSGTVIKSIYEGKLRFVPPGGTSFVSVNDLIDGLLLLLEKGRPGERYIFCTENLEYIMLAKRIAKVLGVKEPRYVLPRFSYYPASWVLKIREFLPASTADKVNLITPQILKESFAYKYYSSEKARRELGWKPLQNLEIAVEKAFKYYRDNRLL